MSQSSVGEILGAVLGGGRGGLGGALEGSLGDALGGMLGGGTSGNPGGALGNLPAGGSADGQTRPQGGTLLAMLLPLAMGWVQRNGGIGAVLDRFRQHGLSDQAASWVSTQPNAPLQSQDVQKVVGDDEIDAMAQKLGVSREQVAQGLSHILPQVIDKVTPEGSVPHDADQQLGNGLSALQSMMRQELSRFG